MLCQIGEFEAPGDTYGLQLIFDESTRGSKRIRSQGAVRPYVHTSYELHSRALSPVLWSDSQCLLKTITHFFVYCVFVVLWCGWADCW